MGSPFEEYTFELVDPPRGILARLHEQGRRRRLPLAGWRRSALREVLGHILYPPQHAERGRHPHRAARQEELPLRRQLHPPRGARVVQERARQRPRLRRQQLLVGDLHRNGAARLRLHALRQLFAGRRADLHASRHLQRTHDSARSCSSPRHASRPRSARSRWNDPPSRAPRRSP